MRLSNNFSILLLSSASILTIGCSSDDSSTPPSTDINIAGTWIIQETSKDSNCDDQTPLDENVLEVAQEGTSSSVTIIDNFWNETYNATLNGYTLTWTGTYEQTANGIDGRTSLNPMKATIDDSCNSLTGEATWTWTAIEGQPYSCSGTTSFIGDRITGSGC